MNFFPCLLFFVESGGGNCYNEGTFLSIFSEPNKEKS